MFCHTKAAFESKIAREMLCFTIETGVGGREGRRCRMGGCVGFSWVSGVSVGFGGQIMSNLLQITR